MLKGGDKTLPRREREREGKCRIGVCNGFLRNGSKSRPFLSHVVCVVLFLFLLLNEKTFS